MANQKDRSESGGGSGGGSGSGTTADPKPQFKVNEKVLCYEPDIKKAQVLYDSKVLNVVRKQDVTTGVYYEYKIHFQGWKCTWDRYVREENVLKSTDVNKELQRTLRQRVDAEKASQKKKKKKISIKDKIQAVAASSANSKELKTKGNENKGTKFKATHEIGKGLTDYDSSDEEGELAKSSEQLVIPDELKKILEYDCSKVKKRKWLVKLPCEISAVELLEEYIRYIGRLELRSYLNKVRNLKSKMSEELKQQSATPAKQKLALRDAANEELIKTIKRISFTKKVVEDIRLMFDLLLPQILLFKTENDQYNQFLNGDFNPHTPPQPIVEKPKVEDDDMDDLVIQNVIKKNMPPPPVPPLKRKSRNVGNAESSKSELDAGRKSKQTVTLAIPSSSKNALGAVDPTTPLEMIPLNKIKTEPLDEEPVMKQRKINMEAADAAKFSGEYRKYVPEPKLLSVPTTLKFKRERFCCELERKCKFPWACQHLNKYMDELNRYQLLPPSELSGEDCSPSTYYGMQHLLRLFVKMPEVLSRTTIPRRKMGSIVEEMNSILLYFTSIRGIVSRSDWHNPGVTLYEEDYINENNCYLFTLGTPSRKLLKKSTKKFRKSLNKSRRRVKMNPSTFSPSPCILATSVKGKEPVIKEEPETNEPISISHMEMTLSTIKKEEVEDEEENTVKRISRRITRKPDPVLSSSATIVMGVRKSLTPEDLSRETLVAPNTTQPVSSPTSNSTNDAKTSYSLRHHSRPSSCK